MHGRLLADSTSRDSTSKGAIFDQKLQPQLTSHCAAAERNAASQCWVKSGLHSPLVNTYLERHLRFRALVPHSRIPHRCHIPYNGLVGEIEGEASEEHGEDDLCSDISQLKEGYEAACDLLSSISENLNPL